MVITSPQPTAPERIMEEIVQLWRNAEFNGLKEFYMTLQFPESRPPVDGLADLLAEITSRQGASNIYNELNAFEKAVEIFETARSREEGSKFLVPVESRSLGLFGRFYQLVVSHYIAGVSQLRDDQLAAELVGLVSRYGSSAVLAQEKEYSPKVEELKKDIRIIRDGYQGIASALQRLVDPKGFELCSALSDASFRAEVYRVAFGNKSEAHKFEIALHAFKYEADELRRQQFTLAEKYLTGETIGYKLKTATERMESK